MILRVNARPSTVDGLMKLSKRARRTTREMSDRSRPSSVGFVGCGNMGSNMAINLAKAGHNVVAFDANVQRLHETRNGHSNISAAESLHEVAQRCQTIVTMLPNAPHVKDVYLNQDTGLLRSIQEDTLLIDSSTIDPIASCEIHDRAVQAGAVMADAPVSGGVPAAAKGTLTFMVGGSKEVVGRASQYLSCMGSNIVHTGGPGSGCGAKLCNNLALGISMAAISEAMILGTRLGIDPKVLAGVMNTSSARCWSSDTYNPCPGVMPGVPSSRNYEGGFAASLMEKDMHLALQSARAAGASLPLGAAAHQLYTLMVGHGGAQKDFSGIYQFIAGQAVPKT